MPRIMGACARFFREKAGIIRSIGDFVARCEPAGAAAA